MYRFTQALISSCLVFFFSNNTQAQDKNIYKYGEEIKPTIFISCEEFEKEKLLTLIGNVSKEKHLKFHYVFLTDSVQNITNLSKSINTYLNNEIWFDKYQLYLLFFKDTSQKKAYDSLDKQVFAETHFQNSKEQFDEKTLSNVIEKFQQKYLWLLDLEKIEIKGKQEVFQKKDFSLGFILGSNWQNTFTKDSTYLPAFILKYGAMVDYKLSNHWHLNTKLLTSIKIPSQKKIEKEIQSQINPSAGSVQSVTAEIAMHIVFQFCVQANYFFNLQKDWQTFVGFGFSTTNFTAAHKKIRTSISTSGGGQNGLGNIGDLTLFTGTANQPFVAFGFSKQLSPNSNFFISCDYNFKIDKDYKGFDSPSIQMGYSFKIGKKAKYFYKYIN